MTMLDGIRIIDLTTVIFGPYATQMLADMGADVIKVEAPGGCVSRLLGPSPDKDQPDMGSIHLTVNRGKRSIMLDLKQPGDAATLRDLIATADVFFHNVRTDAIDKLGFGYDAVRALQPDIIYVHGTGFGQDGPYADLQAYDDIIQAATGTTSLMPRVDGDPRPRYIPSLIADKVAGLYGAQAILAALVHKLRTGAGQHVEVPMFETFTSFMLTEHLRTQTPDPPTGPIGYPRQLDPNRQPYPTKDGYIAIVLYTDAKCLAFFRMVGADALFDDARFATPQDRQRNISAIYAEIANYTPLRTTAEWEAVCADNDIPAMGARDLADIMGDPHLAATDFFRHRAHPAIGGFREMAPPIRFSADPERILGFAPRLGGDGDALRAELTARRLPAE
jgi:crotonobetainyl-CoA:carnitine CoA-transferase CaiB-like acyl-CoA transferase